MKKALITGITGSGASYLADFLVEQGLDVHGIARWHSTSQNNNLKKCVDRVTVHECDLLDLSSVIIQYSLDVFPLVPPLLLRVTAPYREAELLRGDTHRWHRTPLCK